MIMKLSFSVLEWFATISEINLDDEMVKVVEKELKGGSIYTSVDQN